MYLEKTQFPHSFKTRTSAFAEDNFINNVKVKTTRQVRNSKSFSHKDPAPEDLSDMCHIYRLRWATNSS